MRRILFAALIVFCSATSAFAQNNSSRVFPPDNCTTAEQRVITWQDGSQATMCASGQDVLNLAIPVCSEGQAVVREGGQFVCKTVVGTSLPACGAGEFLTFDGTSYGCASTNVPTCAANQLLTYNGTDFQCATMPQSSGPAGSLCGLASARVLPPFGRCANPGPAYPYQSISTCMGSSITTSCPSGYTMSSMTTGKDVQGGDVYDWCMRTCSKN